jgi:endonuclease/exonuclease/phosphatase family metal-dependent hydrolase
MHRAARTVFAVVVTSATVALVHSQQPVTRMDPPVTPHVRLMTWNIAGNSIFPGEDPGGRGARLDGKRPEQFARIVRAIRPDVLCLQEVFPPHSAESVGPMLDSIAPLTAGRTWQSYGIRDVVIATPYPLSMRAARQEDWGGGTPRTHAMAMISFPPELGLNSLYVICTHMQSNGKPEEVAARQREADAIIQWLRELRAPQGSGGLSPGTPFAILGDLNAYHTDPARHVETLLTGNIADTARFGPAMAPDWDGTALADASPLHNGIGPATYTFGTGIGPPPPAALDRILYSDSRLAMAGGFVLNTTTLDAATLARLGLLSTDVLLNATTGSFDHLPLVADFRGRPQ